MAEGPKAALELPLPELQRPRLVVTDEGMPGVDGLVMASELRRRHPSGRVL